MEGGGTAQGASSSSAGPRRQNTPHPSVDTSVGERVERFYGNLQPQEAHHLHPEDAEQFVQFPGDGAELITVQ